MGDARHAGAWSAAAASVWAKTEQGARWGSGEGQGWLSLVQHLEDAAGVAEHLWDDWVPDLVRHRVASEIGGHEAARRLTVFLAGVHDIGKATPAFAHLAHAVQRGELVSAMEREGLTAARMGISDMLRHTVTGHLALQEWLMCRHGYTATRAAALATVVSAHHGTPEASDARIQAVRSTRAMGDSAWDAVRHEILDAMARRTQAVPVLHEIRERKLSLLTLIDLSALVIVADWVASDESRFPYGRLDPDHRLQRGLEDLDLRPPWEPDEVGLDEALFAARFPHLAGVEPTPLQRAAVEAARDESTAPLMLIEAPTGAGKTEAAFLAAEVLASKFQAGGVYVGLPTMATSNAMFGRVARWIEQWPDVHDPALWLAHGKASLNEDFGELVRASRIIQVFDEEDEENPRRPEAGRARVSSWLHGRHRGLLANVVVGTIDQVLMGALQSRYLALRHLALSGKVVIVDEVHSADVYMRSYLCRMLEYFGAYGTPVILLSATLPPAQREELISAYQSGRKHRLEPPKARLMGARRPPVSSSGASAALATGPYARSGGPGPEAYPLVTSAAEEVSHQRVAHDARRFRVQVQRLEDDLETLVSTVTTAVEDGGCVAVMRNTVRRAQDAYQALKQRLGGDVDLFHSRFIAPDRAVRERRLVDRLGPPGAGRDRPARLVVVGTQVLEQSLDVDFDLLITDLAPVDLVLQRIGRLHRHARPDGARPDRLSAPRCLITGVDDWTSQVPRISPVLTYVNPESQLLRSLAVLAPHLDAREIELPQDGPSLVHQAYDPHLSPPPGWESAWERAESTEAERVERSRTKALFGQIPRHWKSASLTGWTSTPVDDRREDTGRAQVRDSEDGIEVILLQRDADGSLRLMGGDFPDGGSELRLPPDDADPTVRHLAACTVGLPQALTNPARWDATVSELEGNGVADDWQESRWLRGQLVLVLDADGTTVLNGHRVAYDLERGLTVRKLEDQA